MSKNHHYWASGTNNITLADFTWWPTWDFDRRSAGKRIPGHVAFMETCDSEQEKAQDPLDFVELVNSNPKIGFLYLSPAVDRSSIEYNPYNLR